MGFRGADQFSTDPLGTLAAGPPSGGGGNMGPSVSIGGISPTQMPSPVQQAGSGAPMPRAPGGGGLVFSTSFGGGSGSGNQPFKSRNENVQKKAKGGKVKKMAKGGSVSSASKRGDGCATKGKTKGRFV